MRRVGTWSRAHLESRRSVTAYGRGGAAERGILGVGAVIAVCHGCDAYVSRIAYCGMRGSAAGVKSYVGVEQRAICRQVCMCSGHGDTNVRRQVIGGSTTESPHVKRNRGWGGGALARSCNARSCYLLSPAAGEMRGCHCTLQERRSPTGFERNVFFFHTINSIEVTMDFLV